MKQPTLPKSISVWTRPDNPTRVEPGGIFDYMDGAGELYLGYRFQHLDVYEYTSPSQGEVLVELYSMESPDDAYGLLSGDWGGEVADLKAAGYNPESGDARALYGAGLLRIWCDNLFVRIVASQETPESSSAVYTLGRAIVAGQPAPRWPALTRSLPASVDSVFRLREGPVFLRSHLVLNSAYFLSSENLLDLGLNVEAVVATYASAKKKIKPVRLLMLRYPDGTVAQSALEHFKKVYLAEKYKDANSPTLRSAQDGAPSVIRIEDGWMGFAQSGRGLALVFECPDEQSAGSFMKSAVQALERMEAAHE